MAEQKAVCGGFLVGEGLKMEGKVLSAEGSGSPFIVKCLTHDWDSEDCTFDADYNTIHEKVVNNESIIITLDDDGYQTVFRPLYYNDSVPFVRFMAVDDETFEIIDIGDNYTQCFKTCIRTETFMLTESGDNLKISGSKKLKDMFKNLMRYNSIITYKSGVGNILYKVIEYKNHESITISRTYVDGGNIVTKIWKCEGEDNNIFTLIGTSN